MPSSSESVRQSAIDVDECDNVAVPGGQLVGLMLPVPSVKVLWGVGKHDVVALTLLYVPAGQGIWSI